MIDEWGKGAKYWDKAWNPVIGCQPVSEGCQHCYAARLAERFPELQDDAGGFTPHAPKKQKSPPRSGVVFIGNMTDIFGEWNSDDDIYRWFDALSGDAIANLVLTKRISRLLQFQCNHQWIRSDVWYGMTAENQQRYDDRIKDFRCFFNPIKWLSAEPLLGPIDMQLRYIAPEDMPVNWVVVGAESGSDRRPCCIDWVTSIVHQCQAANVPVFVKQLDIGGTLVTDINKFPPELQIRQIPWVE